MGQRNPERLCLRAVDGTWWEPSIPDDYTEAQAMRDTMMGSQNFFFRGGYIKTRRKWLVFKSHEWVRGDAIWQPASGQFAIYSWKDAIKVEQEMVNGYP